MDGWMDEWVMVGCMDESWVGQWMVRVCVWLVETCEGPCGQQIVCATDLTCNMFVFLSGSHVLEKHLVTGQQ